MEKRRTFFKRKRNRKPGKRNVIFLPKLINIKHIQRHNQTSVFVASISFDNPRPAIKYLGVDPMRGNDKSNTLNKTFDEVISYELYKVCFALQITSCKVVSYMATLQGVTGDKWSIRNQELDCACVRKGAMKTSGED